MSIAVRSMVTDEIIRGVSIMFHKNTIESFIIRQAMTIH
jgi:hypothetical protein